MKTDTENYERQVWYKLTSLLADVVPEGATQAQGEDAVLAACMGHDPEIHKLYKQVKRLTRDRAGYLRDRLEEDNPVARVRRRLYGRWAEKVGADVPGAEVPRTGPNGAR